MREMGLQGVIRGKPITTVSDSPAWSIASSTLRHRMGWGLGLAYVATWAGFVYAAFVNACIAGWRVSRTAHAGFVLDALEQALHARRPVHRGGLNPPRLILSRGWGAKMAPL